MTRSPSSPIRCTLASARECRSSSQGMEPPPDRALVVRPSTAGAAPLTKQRTTLSPPSPGASANTAMSL